MAPALLFILLLSTFLSGCSRPVIDLNYKNRLYEYNFVVHQHRLWIIGGEYRKVTHRETRASTVHGAWSQTLEQYHTFSNFTVYSTTNLNPIVEHLYYQDIDYDQLLKVSLDKGWQKMGDTDWPHTRRKHAHFISFQDKIWMFGGKDGDNHNLTDAWYSSNAVDWVQAGGTSPWAHSELLGPDQSREVALVYSTQDRLFLVTDRNRFEPVMIWMSEDGSNWSRLPLLPGILNCDKILVMGDDFCVLGRDKDHKDTIWYTSFKDIHSSYRQSRWKKISLENFGSISGITVFKNRMWLYSDTGIHHSQDLQHWKNIKQDLYYSPVVVHWEGSLYMRSGRGLLTSLDGLEWKAIPWDSGRP